MPTPVYAPAAKKETAQPVKIVSVDIPFKEVFALVFRVALSIAIIAAALGVFYSVIVGLVR